jgi:hypothetical protein
MARSSLAKQGLAAAALVSVALGVGGCDAGRGAAGVETRVAAVDGEFTVDVTQPIGQRWQQIGGMAVLGNPSSAVEVVPGLEALYQTFANGVIVWSNDYGAVRLPREIFDKWLSLDGQTVYEGLVQETALVAIGVPTGDFAFIAPTVQTVAFQLGRIYFYGNGTDPVVVRGKIYRLTQLVGLGLPVADEAPMTRGFVQSFQFGDAYWNGEMDSEAVSIYAAAPIRQRYADLGGPSGALGLPISNVELLYAPDGQTVIGKSSHFENGVIFLNGATSAAWEMMNGVILDLYQSYGGPRGWPGFPISASGISGAGDAFNDFEHGVLVDRQGIVYPFGELTLYWGTMYGSETDGIGGTAGDVDLYADVELTVNDFTGSQRLPGGDDFYGSGEHFIDIDTPLGDANSALHVHVQMVLWDADGFLGNDDDKLGTLIDDYSIDNLWGFDTDHSDLHHQHHATAFFSVKNTHQFDRTDFRGQLWWPFGKFVTEELRYDQFASTFVDVNHDESAWIHPFNSLYYNAVYKSIAHNGNCFGMSLESIFAQVNHSPFGEPIHEQYFPDTQVPNENGTGPFLDPLKPNHAALMNQLNIKHGYQLGATTYGWFLTMWALGLTHDPVAVFENAHNFFDAEDYPVITLMEDYMFGGRQHTIRPFKFEKTLRRCPHIDGSSKCWLIHVANPDVPMVDRYKDSAFIEIDSEANSFYYADSFVKDTFRGDYNSGSRMFFLPFHLYTGPQTTPFFTAAPLHFNDEYIILSDNSTLGQASDGEGRTLFKDSYTLPPAKFDDLRGEGDPAGMADIAPAPGSDGSGTTRTEMYLARPAAEATHHFDVGPAPGVAAGAPVEMTLESRLLSAFVSIPATPGKPDRVSAIAMGTANKTIALTIASDSEPKTVTSTIAGPDKQGWKTYTVPMVPGQTITFHPVDGGKQMENNNTGPETIAQVTVHSGAGTPPIDMGPVTIPHGTSTTGFKLPVTTLSLSGEVSGNAGWLTTPPTVTLTAQDLSGTGIAAIQFGPDGVNWTTYTGPFPYTTEGASTLHYRARDNANNLELPKTHGFKIDTRKPTATGSVSTASGVVLTYAVTDPTPGSGAAGLHVLQQGTPTFLTGASGTATLSGSCSAVEFWGEDVAGNLTTPHVKIADTVRPVFTTAPPATIATTLCTVAAGLNLGTPVASDDCASVTITNNAPAKFPLGTTIVTWTARDAAGNTATKTTTVTADLGDDVSCCPTGTNIILGTNNSDILNGTSGADCILGRGGQDVISGNGGNDALSGGSGNDALSGGDGDDWLSGGAGADALRGENGNDTLSGGDGDDACSGGNNDDKLMGGNGNDALAGDPGNDTLMGDAGNDALNGGSGNDFLRGGTETDALNGGGGTDQCVQDGGDTMVTCTAVAP